MTACAHAEV